MNASKIKFALFALLFAAGLFAGCATSAPSAASAPTTSTAATASAPAVTAPVSAPVTSSPSVAPTAPAVAQEVKYELQPFEYAKGSLTNEDDDPKTPRTGQVVLCLAGDSTVTYNAGYAAGLRSHFDTRLQVINRSHGGATCSSFRAQHRWQDILDIKPDYVMIQFGHNDGQRDIPGYTANLERFVDEARAAGIKPILVTPVARRYWQDDGSIKDDLDPNVAAMRQVAAEKHVPIMQLHDRAIELYKKVGKAETDTWGLPKPDPNNPSVTIFDKTHFTSSASQQMGAVVADELKHTVPDLAQYIH